MHAIKVRLRTYSKRLGYNALRSRLSFSVGLIVIDSDSHVFLLERQVPYMLEKRLYKEKKLNLIKDRLELTRICKTMQTQSYCRDIQRFLNTLDQPETCFFEDQYDLPHGQSETLTQILAHRRDFYSLDSKIITALTFRLRFLLADAYREWTEETGYSIEKFNVHSFLLSSSSLDVVAVTFLGCDNVLYTQIYFVLQLKKEMKIVLNKQAQEMAYSTQIIDIGEAIRILGNQDRYVQKNSFKSKMLQSLHADNQATTETHVAVNCYSFCIDYR